MESLIVVDMQKDFCYEGGALYIGKSAEKIFKPLRKVIEAARNKMPVIYTQDWHRKDDAEFKIWEPHCLMNTEGAEIVDELEPAEKDYLVRKRRYSGFYGTDLDLILRELGVKKLFVVGVATNICVLHTVSDATLLNYEVNVLEDCTATLTDYAQEYGIKHMSDVLNARIINSGNFLKGQ
ncbi:MAG TPA: cysteine hydrolase [Archaeoglobaceae archaeon]|nr:cysteine hydrolase [Archaeoglobaceae archaeon]